MKYNNFRPKRVTEEWGYINENQIEIRRNSIFQLNQIASFIWENCTGDQTISEIITKLCLQCNLDDDSRGEVSQDVIQILKGWQYDDLLILNFSPLHSFSEYSETEYPLKLREAENVDLLLFVPPTPTPMTYGNPANRFEPLGIGYMESYLRSFGYTSIASENFWTTQLNKNTICSFLRKYNPKIIGISSMTDNFENGMLIAKIAKEYNNNIKIICGGPHATYEDINILHKYPFVDLVIRGEGEITMLELMNYYTKQFGNLSDILGITYRHDGSVIQNKDRPMIEDLDELPFPKRRSVNSEDSIGIQTSRGCPGKCIFCCAAGLSGGRYRMRSAENVVKEIEELYQQGGRYFFFQDDTVTVHLARLYRILELLEEKQLDIIWDAESRVDVISKDKTIFHKMKSVGCRNLQFGIESGSQLMLDNLKKNITVEQIYKAVESARSADLNVICTFLIGHPFETKESINDTYHFAKKLIDLGAETGFSIVCPYPGTEIRAKANQYEVFIHDFDFKDYNILNPVMDVRHLNRKEIKTYYYSVNKDIEKYQKLIIKR